MKFVKPQVSIIITYYKKKDFIKRTLKSIFSQTYKNFEVIVADDGSSKETKELAYSYKNKLKINHVWHADEGFRAAKIRNEAVKISSGKYLVFIDGDCITYNDFIKNHRKISEYGYFARGNRAMLSHSFSKHIINSDQDINLISNIEILKLRFFKDINRILPTIRITNLPFRKIFKLLIKYCR